MVERSYLEEKSNTPGITIEQETLLYNEYRNIEKVELAYNICHLLFVFWVPALIILSSYLTILCILNNFSRERSGTFSKSSYFLLNFGFRIVWWTEIQAVVPLHVIPVVENSKWNPRRTAFDDEHWKRPWIWPLLDKLSSWKAQTYASKQTSCESTLRSKWRTTKSLE